MQAYGRIDVLVNNAGIFKAADFLDVTEADFDAVLRVNLKGSFLMGQAVAREMAKAQPRTGADGHASRGAIVNMSSVNAVLTIPSIASYNVSKGGINQLTRVMALALADKGIRVNAVAPGTIATELARQGGAHQRGREGPHHEPHADETAGGAVGDRRHGGLPGERCGELHHRRNCRRRWGPSDTELHRSRLARRRCRWSDGMGVCPTAASSALDQHLL